MKQGAGQDQQGKTSCISTQYEKEGLIILKEKQSTKNFVAENYKEC